MSGAKYDRIGIGYAGQRHADPRIAAQVQAAVLGSTPSRPTRVVNVGAGTGSYELLAPVETVAVEPSATMRDQRAPGSAPCIGAVAEALPFADQVFDVATAFLTVHHWPDPQAGLDELKRVATRKVIFTFDPDVHDQLWLIRDYLPECVSLPASHPPTPEQILDRLGGGRIEVLTVPSDCQDGFLWAWWKRPEAYLDPQVQQSISAIALLSEQVVERGMTALAEDLKSGRWHERNEELMECDEIDGGYRLAIAG